MEKRVGISKGIEISIHALLAESDCVRPQSSHCLRYFYPRSPCGERPSACRSASTADKISIHALLAESDIDRDYRPYKLCISIHALLAESDIDQMKARGYGVDFYPRSPCGERLPVYSNLAQPIIFLSTLSLRRATAALTGTFFA